MRIMQRPKSDKLFKDEKEKADFMNKMFIENVWCFGDKDFDLFRDANFTNPYFNNKEDGEWIFMSEKGEKILAGFFYKGQKIQTWTHWYSERMKKKQIECSGGTKISELCWNNMGNIINCM